MQRLVIFTFILLFIIFSSSKYTERSLISAAGPGRDHAELAQLLLGEEHEAVPGQLQPPGPGVVPGHQAAGLHLHTGLEAAGEAPHGEGAAPAAQQRRHLGAARPQCEQSPAPAPQLRPVQLRHSLVVLGSVL